MNSKDIASNIHIQEFATELSAIVDQYIGLDHIHISPEGRFFYTQAPLPGSPLLLHHYRGPFFVDIHPDDLEKIMNGVVPAHDYILQANWLIGYSWGGGSMIGGGYYQPFDIVNRQDEVIRYFKILSCRGNRRASGYMPSKENCDGCSIRNCPFSMYKDGNWENELQEYDPRMDLFRALKKLFEEDFPGYTFEGFSCSKIPDDQIILSPCGHYSADHPYAFTVSVSENVVRGLLMRTITPPDWEKYAMSFTLQICTPDNHFCEVTPENIRKAFEKVDFSAMHTNVESNNTVDSHGNVTVKEHGGILAAIRKFFANV